MEKKTGFKSMSAEDKAKLIIWINSNKALCESLTDPQLQQKFFDDTQVDTSLSSIFTYKKAVFPGIKRKKPVGGSSNGGKLLSRISDIDRRLTALESFLNS